MVFEHEQKEAFYCTEIWTHDGTTAQGFWTREDQGGNFTPPAVSFTTRMATCTEWHSWEGDETFTDYKEFPTSTSTSPNFNLYHGDILLGIGVIVFFLSMIFMGLVFNTFYGRR